jgi:Uma2 family endonuclease
LRLRGILEENTMATAPTIAPALPLAPRAPKHAGSGPYRIADWVASERASAVRHELHGGVLIEMSGGTYEHSAIATDLSRTLGNLLEDAANGCDVVNSDLKVYVAPDRGFYPDVTVVCGPPQVDFEEVLRNPAAIFEVLSDSTEAFDRGDKFRQYRGVETLQHYVLVEQYRPALEHWERQADGRWLLVAEPASLSESLPLTLNGVTVLLPLARVYRRVPFAPEAGRA